jgi:cell division control protein 7
MFAEKPNLVLMSCPIGEGVAGWCLLHHGARGGASFSCCTTTTINKSSQNVLCLIGSWSQHPIKPSKHGQHARSQDGARGHPRRLSHAQRGRDRRRHGRKQEQHGRESGHRIRWKRRGGRGFGPGRHYTLRAVVQEHFTALPSDQSHWRRYPHFFSLHPLYSINPLSGTFSTVYKAEDLLYDKYKNNWNDMSLSPTAKTARDRPRARYVAIKKIYVTSSPMRIFNELELLYDLRDSQNVCPLITAFRHQDQVVAVLPYFQHRDFRDYFREMTVNDMRVYFNQLFTAVRAVHQHQIIHRDIKPTNFLYSPTTQKGVLVDFGLAEREGTDWHHCNCQYSHSDRQYRYQSSLYSSIRTQYRDAGQLPPPPTYPKEDSRNSRRANRAGTRGFRAPEVLLKCTSQTCIIDIWSCGIILLTLLSRRFPFFHSADDIDAFIELCSIFGKRRMNEAALLHGQVLQTNIPTISETGHSWEKILLWCTERRKTDLPLSDEEKEAVQFMSRCLELDPSKRITADEALEHPFLNLDASDRSQYGGDDNIH